MVKKITDVKAHVKNDGTAVVAHRRTYSPQQQGSSTPVAGPPPPSVDEDGFGKNGPPNCVSDSLSRGWIVNVRGEFVFVGQRLLNKKDEKGWVKLTSGEYAWLGPETVLENVDLSNTDLSGVKLSKSKLVGCNLSKTNLSFALIADSFIKDCNFSRSNFDEAFIYGSIIQNCNFSDVKSMPPKMTRNEIVDSNLKGANFQGLFISHSKLTGNTWGANNIRTTSPEVNKGIPFVFDQCEFEQYGFHDAAKTLGLSDRQFEFVVVSGALEVRDGTNHDVVTKGFDPENQYIPVWTIHDHQQSLGDN